jgi:hypothetical protein
VSVARRRSATPVGELAEAAIVTLVDAYAVAEPLATPLTPVIVNVETCGVAAAVGVADGGSEDVPPPPPPQATRAESNAKTASAR